MAISRGADASDIKQVPEAVAVREALRRVAGEVAAGEQAPVSRGRLEQLGAALLARLGLLESYLGYAMVAVSNAVWAPHVAGVPYGRRLLLLPRCLSAETCTGVTDGEGLHCAACGGCDLFGFTADARLLGYQTLVAEGTSTALLRVIDGGADAIVGVACLDSLEKSFARIADLGIPHLAVPLLRDGCAGTEAEADEVRAALYLTGAAEPPLVRTCLPLLRETGRIFTESLPALLRRSEAGRADIRQATEEIALDWLGTGGKRLRPFLTVAAYAVARHGAAALAGDAPVAELIPDSVRRLAVAIEAMHKASLIHDDIEDDDDLRYGSRTLHREYDIPIAINVGDYLVGLGYRLIAGEAEALGGDAASDMLAHLSAAHLDLCRGQGAELLWQHRGESVLTPADVLGVYALKTAPAFEAALFTGLRAAGPVADRDALHALSTYVGEGYQILDDLDDWRDDNTHALGRDVLAGCPTLLRAFALEAVGVDQLRALPADPGEAVEVVRAWYREAGVFAKAEGLLARIRTRALEQADAFTDPALRELMGLLVRIVLRTAATRGAGR